MRALLLLLLSAAVPTRASASGFLPAPLLRVAEGRQAARQLALLVPVSRGARVPVGYCCAQK